MQARYFKVFVDDSYWNTGWLLSTIAEFRAFAGAINVAQGKETSESGHYNIFSSDKAVDGLMSTFSEGWVSQHEQPNGTANQTSTNVWWQVDLGQAYEVTSAYLTTGESISGYATIKSYRVYSSLNGTDWTLVNSFSNMPSGLRTDTVLDTSIKTNLTNISTIGDKIAVRYKGKSNEIGSFSDIGNVFAPSITKGTVAPDGSFYLVYVGDDYFGRKIMVADRNVQSSVSWDVINAKGFVNGNTITSMDITDGLPASAFTASTEYNSSFGASMAFNNTWDTNNANCWFSLSGVTTNQWLRVDFVYSTVVHKLRYQADAYDSYRCGMKSFKVQGSVDGTTWVDQYTGVAQANGAVQEFSWTPTGSFRYWRVFMTDNHGNVNYLNIGEMELVQVIEPKGVTIRLLTGGETTTDPNNEWFQYIINSDLNGKITAGSDIAWNWSGTGGGSWTSTVAAATTRVVRGNGTVATHTTLASATATATYANFRPVFALPPMGGTFEGRLSATEVTFDSTVLTGTISHAFLLPCKYRILVGGVERSPYGSLSMPPFSVNYTISNNDLAFGNNLVTIEISDSIDSITSFYLTVTKNPVTKYLIKDGTYKRYINYVWETVGVVPSQDMFVQSGMSSLTPLYTEIREVPYKSELVGLLGNGKTFKVSVNKKDLKITRMVVG